MRWFQESIEDMNPEGCYEQGMFFYNEKNYRISLLYKEKGAEGNYGDVQAHLGLMYLQGHGVEKYRKQAMRWLQQSITRYGPYGCRKKGLEFYQSGEIDNNYGIALLYFKNAEEYRPEAKFQLGMIYLNGIGIERNYNEAMEWIKSSVEEMPDYECHKYGMHLYNGIKSEKKHVIALIFLRKAADQNYGLSQAQIGLMYLDGHGVSESNYEAMRWIEKSLENMKRDRCYDLGFRLYSQYESEKHLVIAWIFINKAAEEGNGLAQALLGEMYLEGKGAQKNQDEALKWIEKSVRNLKSNECYDQ
jgi:TPR repeat protein